MAKSSSCDKCGAKLVEGAEICDLCGTLVSSDGASVPDWIDDVEQVEPAYRTIPDPTILAGSTVVDLDTAVAAEDSD
ncbi:MAG: hypothetical protein HKN13_03850, partial [Rhodothermales bacterium]|nr:hypothetical protein [Rhodothermales bacterium]